MIFSSHSLEQTKTIAAEFAATLSGGETILLEGELGAGKTTFTQGLVQALGGAHATSPTFAIMNVYEAGGRRQGGGGIKRIVHLDFYRMKSEKELLELGLEEWLGKSDAIVVMEWPPAALHLPALKGYRVRFVATDVSSRTIDIAPLS